MPSPTQSNQIQAQAGEPTKMERPTYHIVFHWDPNTGIQQMGLAKIDKAEADWYAARTHLAFVATIPGSVSSSPSSKQEDDPANYPDPRFKWDGKPVEVRGSVVWFKPAGGNGEHGWGQFNPYEAKRLALFINSAIAPPDSKPPTQSEDHIADAGKMVEATKPTESVQSEPIKDLVEQARQISKPQSVQSEGKVPRGATLTIRVYQEDGCWVAHCEELDVLTADPSRETAESDIRRVCEAQIMFGIKTRSVSRVLNYRFVPTQPKDSKEMGPEWLPPGAMPWNIECSTSPFDILERDRVWRSALKSANERAEAAEKKLECARVNGFLDSMED